MSNSTKLMLGDRKKVSADGARSAKHWFWWGLRAKAARNWGGLGSEKATVVTDGLKSYDFLDAARTHGRYVQSGKNKVKENESRLEHVHLVISLLKRWLLGTHQGAVTPMHLAGYLDEFAFRFNRRTSMHRGKLFYRLVEQAVTTRPKPIKDFYVTGRRKIAEK